MIVEVADSFEHYNKTIHTRDKGKLSKVRCKKITKPTTTIPLKLFCFSTQGNKIV